MTARAFLKSPSEIAATKSHLSWLKELDRWEEEVIKIDYKQLDRSNPLVIFAESLTSRFEFAEKNSVNRLRFEEFSKIISQAFAENQVILPWDETLDFRNEVLRVDDDVEEIILTKPSEGAVLDIARKKGMMTMKEDALLKAFDGKISIREVNQFE